MEAAAEEVLVDAADLRALCALKAERRLAKKGL